MKKINRRKALHGPLQRKTFHAAFAHELQEQIPSLGNLTADALALHFEKMIDIYFPPTEKLRMGQMLWPAVAKETYGSWGRTIEETPLRPVVLSVITNHDLKSFLDGVNKFEIKRQATIRLFYEADRQNAVLTLPDVAAALGLSTSTVCRYVREHEKKTGDIVPRRGTIHDMGPSVSHKREICYRAIVQGHSTERVASETNHTPEAVTRYVQTYRRVVHCLKCGFSIADTAFATKLSTPLVEQYKELYHLYKTAHAGEDQLTS